jgi:hypothetical protein
LRVYGRIIPTVRLGHRRGAQRVHQRRSLLDLPFGSSPVVGRPALNRHDLDRRPGAAARSRHAPGIQSRRDPSQGRDARFSDLLDHRV